MAKNRIEESEQLSQGVTLGTQGNQDMTIPKSTRGGEAGNKNTDDRHIPHQERSSATNEEKAKKGS